VDFRCLWRALAGAALSLLCAGAAYALWLAAFLLAPGLEGFLWLLAPAVTALGFAAGMALFERLAGTGRTPFLRLYAWPLAGCALGALVVYGFGPMLIVFGMLGAGTASVLAREVALRIRQARSGDHDDEPDAPLRTEA
jgi:hypothetical protein